MSGLAIASRWAEAPFSGSLSCSFSRLLLYRFCCLFFVLTLLPTARRDVLNSEGLLAACSEICLFFCANYLLHRKPPFRGWWPAALWNGLLLFGGTKGYS